MKAKTYYYTKIWLFQVRVIMQELLESIQSALIAKFEG